MARGIRGDGRDPVRARRGQGNYGGVWTIVALSVLVSIVLYELMTIVETALLARWGPEAGVSR